MRLAGAVPLALITLATCAPAQSPPRHSDLKIDVVLVKDGGRCVVQFADAGDKDARKAVTSTAHAVVWRVVDNSCGEIKKNTAKALGLKFLKARKSGAPPFWLRDYCSSLPFIPAKVQTPLTFRCDIPSVDDPGWGKEWEGVENIEYDYEIDGDSVEPVDPGLDVKRNG